MSSTIDFEEVLFTHVLGRHCGCHVGLQVVDGAGDMAWCFKFKFKLQMTAAILVAQHEAVWRRGTQHSCTCC
jgi:hypothetical protein